MRRKSERNKARSPEKKPEKSSRRTRRRKGSPESEDERGSDNEDVKRQPEIVTKKPSTDSKESSNSDGESKEQSVWQVKSDDAPTDTGEIKKLKICLQRPSSSERSPTKHHGSSQESADSSEEVRKKRSKKHSHSSKENDEKLENQANQTVEPVDAVDSIDSIPTPPENDKLNEVEVKQERQADVSTNVSSNDNENVESSVQAKEEPNENVESSVQVKEESNEIVESTIQAKEEPNENVESSVQNKEEPNETVENIVQVKEELNKTVNNEIKKVHVEEMVCENQEPHAKEKVNSIEKIETKSEEDAIAEVPKKPPVQDEVPVEQEEKPEDDRASENSSAKSSPKPETSESPINQPNVNVESAETTETETQDKTEITNDIESKPATELEKGDNMFEHLSKYESSSSTNDSEKVTRKRKWGSKHSTTSDKKPAVAISTDSLKNLISDVKPLSVNDVLLENKNSRMKADESKRSRTNSKSEEKKEDRKLSDTKLDLTAVDYEADEPSDKESDSEKIERKRARSSKSESERNEKSSDHGKSRRKISVNENVPEKKSRQPVAHKPSEILYITNLVRPFTVLQLKGLLARTGKLIENGFWIDNIKSRCFVRYENEDQAVETRHALHGTRWPASNPKLLQVEFSTSEEMEKCLSSLPPPPPSDNIRRTIDSDKVAMAWLTEQNFKDEKIRDREALRDRKQSVREWDLGKNDPDMIENTEKYNRDAPAEYSKEAIGRDRRDDRYDNREKRRSRSRTPVRRYKRKEDDAPAKRLDDLFKKTKVTPCIYWLPLTPEQIAVKEEMRRQHMAEHERRKEEIRKQEREREKERQSRREHRRTSSTRDRNRRNSSRNSRDRNNH